MVRTIKNEKRKDPVTGTLFLSSINSWYNTNGIECGVERVGNIFQSKNNDKVNQIPVTLSIIDNMPKCRARLINDDGEVVMKEDEVTGKEIPEIEIINDPDEVTFFFKLKNYYKKNDKGKLTPKDDEEQEYLIHNMSNAFPLFNHAFIASGEIEPGNKDSIITTHEEIVDCLDGYEFVAKCEKRSFEQNKTKYNVLIAEHKKLE